MDIQQLQQDAYRATEYLRDTAAEIGAAKADMVLAEATLKRTKALAMKASDANAISAQERDAYASSQYDAATQEVFNATKDYETLRAGREAANAKIAMWQTASANQRAFERGMGSAA